MNRQFWRCAIQLNNRFFYTIWYDNDYSGFHLTEDYFIAAFSSVSKLESHATMVNFQLETQCKNYNLDVIAEWLEKPKGKSVSCGEFLDLYNLAGDFRNSLAERNLDVEDKSHSDLLVKLFWGCNLPAVTPAGKKFRPVWSKAEVRELRRVMRESLKVFVKHLHIQDNCSNMPPP